MHRDILVTLTYDLCVKKSLDRQSDGISEIYIIGPLILFFYLILSFIFKSKN